MRRKCNIEQAVELYKSGLSTTQIAVKLGCSPVAVLRALQISGAEMRSRGEANHLRRRERKGRTTQGYVSVNYEMRKKKTEHRWVMETVLGRHLQPDEHIHHINGDKTDNRPENLMLISNADHARLHAQERKENGIFISPPQKKRVYDYAQMISLYQSGLSSIKIAEIIGCSRNTILYALKTLGINARNLSEAQILRYQQQ